MTTKKKKPLKFQGWMTTAEGVKKAKIMVTAFTLEDVCKWLEDTFQVKCTFKGMDVTMSKSSKKATYTFEVVTDWETENVHPDCFTHTLAVVPKLNMTWYSNYESPNEQEVPIGDYCQVWKQPFGWTTQWDIDIRMNLVENCANLYTMYDTMINMPNPNDYPDVAKAKSWSAPYDCENTPISTVLQYQDTLRRLEGQFSRYFDMIVGGELRHITRHIPQAVLDPYLKDKPKGYKVVVDAIRERNKDKGEDMIAGNTDRGVMWSEWLALRQELGIEAMYAARDLYRDHLWGTTFGGEKWALICDVLIRHLEKQDTDIIFVDTAWSIQHNGGVALNKVWQIHPKLTTVLDAKFSGNTGVVSKYASEWVRLTWERRTGGRGTTPTRSS